MSKKVLIIVLITIFLISIITIFCIRNIKKEDTTKGTETTSKDKEENITKKENDNKKEEEKSMYSSGLHHSVIEVKDYGTIKLELDADTAPITVTNFANLVNEGFYDGLTFHRIIDGFMIQGGDPLGNGTGGSSKTIKGEFKVNGVDNNISHIRGVISMARSSFYNSASSQFFIVHEDSVFLDGQYAAFGKVTEGIEVVDKICKDIKVEDNNGTVSKKNQPIIEKITMID